MASVARAYSRLLETRPLLGKCATYFVVLGTADIICQRITRSLAQPAVQLHAVHVATPAQLARQHDKARAGRDIDNDGSGDPATPSGTGAGGGAVAVEAGHDWARTTRLAVYGCLVVAPTLHMWHAGIERAFARLGPTRPRIILLKSALELCFLGPCMITSMYTWNGLLTGMTLEDVARKCKRDLVPAWKVAACCFGPAGLINYAFVPLRFRVTVASVVSLFWNVFLSYMAAKPAPHAALTDDDASGSAVGSDARAADHA